MREEMIELSEEMMDAVAGGGGSCIDPNGTDQGAMIDPDGKP